MTVQTSPRTGLRVEMAKAIILGSQRIPLFAARGAYSSVASDSDADKAAFEYSDQDNFLENIPFDFRSFIRDKKVLDLGSGYGGRTVWMSEYASEVIGIEVMTRRVTAGEQFARRRERHNCRFLLAHGQELPLDPASVDVVTSFDVIEHVRDPEVTLREIFRVLKPGGTAVLIFTPYYGAFAHHLNYATLCPALHWVFSAKTLMSAISRLSEEKLSGMQMPPDIAVDPSPRKSFNGRRVVLPSLNGVTKREFLSIAKATGFTYRYLRSRGILEKWRVLGPPGAWVNRAVCTMPFADELFAHNLTVILEKARREQARSADV